MKFVRGLLLFMSIMLIFGSAGADMKKAKHKVEIDDPAGDVKTGDHPGKDVIKVILATDGKKLDITVVLKERVKFYLDGHMAGKVVEVYLDTDNNKETGDKLFGVDLSGFEYQIDVGACIEYGENFACGGRFTGAKATNFCSTYDLFKIAKDKIFERISETSNWKTRGKDIKGNRVEVSLLYSMMNLSSGQSVRITIKESDFSGSFKVAYMPEVLLTLK